MPCPETAFHAAAQVALSNALRGLLALESEDPSVAGISAELQPGGQVIVVLWGSGGEQVGEYAL